MKKIIGYQKGINLGGWFSQREYSKEYLDTFITEDDFKIFSKWDIDHIRLPVDYNIFENSDGAYIEDGFNYIDNVIRLCQKYKLNMLLDLHKTAGYSFDSGEKESGFFDNIDLQERFYRLWEQFAIRFGNNGSKVAFELLNEITDQSFCERWNSIADECIHRIRAISPDVYIFIGSYWMNSVDAIKDLDKPYDNNIVYNFHCYDPMLFTHQSAEWVKNMPLDFKISYPASVKEYSDTQKEKLPSFSQVYDNIPLKDFNSDYFIMRFENAVKIAEERDVALYCGEYGVINKANSKDTLCWYRDINAAFEKFGIGRAAWSYRAVDFGIIDSNLDDVRDELIKYL